MFSYCIRWYKGEKLKSFIKIGKHHITLGVRFPYLKSTGLRIGFSGRVFMGRIVNTIGIVSNCEHEDCKGKTLPFFDFDSGTDILEIYASLIKIVKEYPELGNMYVFKSLVNGEDTHSYRIICPVMIDKEKVLRMVAKVDNIDLDFLQRLLRYKSQTIRITDKASSETVFESVLKVEKFDGKYHYPHMRILNEYLGVPILHPCEMHNTKGIIKAIYETVSW